MHVALPVTAVRTAMTDFLVLPDVQVDAVVLVLAENLASAVVPAKMALQAHGVCPVLTGAVFLGRQVLLGRAVLLVQVGRLVSLVLRVFPVYLVAGFPVLMALMVRRARPARLVFQVRSVNQAAREPSVCAVRLGAKVHMASAERLAVLVTLESQALEVPRDQLVHEVRMAVQV